MEKVNIDLSVIIISYKSKEHLKVLLPSVFVSERVKFVGSLLHEEGQGEVVGKTNNQSNPTMTPTNSPSRGGEYIGEVIIVDNDSRDSTYEWLQATSYKLKTVRNANTGFAAGNNLGIKQARGRYILLLNPDTRLQSDTLRVMLNFMETHPQVGISGCKIIKPDGTLDLACRRRFPNPWNSFRRLFLKDNRNYNYSDIDENQEMEVESVVGAFLLFRRSVIDKIGLLDEKFFLYGEDLDWCWRCREAGYKVWYYPHTFITHYKGSSSKKAPFKSLKAFHDAMWIFYKKYYWQKYFIPFHWLIWIGIYSRLVLLAIINFFKRERVISKS